MRKRLMAAVALAPLSFLALQPAHGQTLTISNGSNTPVSTATAVSGGPGDIDVASGGTLTPKAPGAAITLNSNNKVTNEGTIQSQNVTNSTGILVLGGFTGSVTNNSEISLSEDYTPSDSKNTDGIAEAPFARDSQRYGIHVAGSFTGDITNLGSIDIQGNNSYGILIDSGSILTGSLNSPGAINMVGDKSFAINTTGAEITGNVLLTGAISVKGLDSVAVQTGQIDGSLKVYSTITSTGYAITSRVTGTDALNNIQNTPTDVEQGGSALSIQGSVAGGVFIGAPPTTTVSTDTTTDADGDGIVDSVEATASITTFGSAPAIVIGSQTGAINLGNFGTTPGLTAFGLIIRGDVSAQGLFDGVSSTAVQIGGFGTTVNLNGGIYIPGTIGAQSYEADATTIHLGNGVIADTFQNSGTLTASITAANAHLATVLQIDAGATVNTFSNFGTLETAITGNKANGTVVVDNSGTLHEVFNEGQVVTSFTTGEVGQAILGTGVAFDLRANTTGILFNQSQNTTDSTFIPVIVGDVLLGSGPNTVQIEAGSVQGTLDIGKSTSSLDITGATYTGDLKFAGDANNLLSINIAGNGTTGGVLHDNLAATINTSTLKIDGSSTLYVALDPANTATPNTQFLVYGSTNIAAGAKIGATILSTPSLTGETFTIIKTMPGATLNVAAADSTLLSSLPFLFDGSLHTDTAAGTVNITITTKTPAELALNKAETAAFPAIYASLGQDAGISQAILGATTRSTLVSAYDQLLPNSSGDVFETALSFSKAVSRATGDRFDLTTETTDEDLPVRSGFWATEFYNGLDQQKQDNNAYHSAGLGIIGGYDFGGTGMTFAAGSSNVTQPHTSGDSLDSVSVVEGGLYAAPTWGPLNFDARVGLGYVKVSDRRQLVATVVSGDLSTATTVSRTAEGDWSGYDFSGHVGVGFQWNATRHLFFQPKLYADIFHLHENSYSERNTGVGLTGAGFDYNAQARDSTQTNATASLVTGMRFGSSFVFSPQLELGYDDVLSGGPGDTTAQFAYGGPSFTVAANKVKGAAVARFTLKGDGNFVHFAMQAGGEYNNDYRSLDLKAIFRLLF